MKIYVILLTLVALNLCNAEVAAASPGKWPLPHKLLFKISVAGVYRVYHTSLQGGQPTPDSYDSLCNESQAEPEFNDVGFKTGYGLIAVNVDDSSVASSFNGSHAHLVWHYVLPGSSTDHFDLILDCDLDTANHTISSFKYSRSSVSEPSTIYDFSIVLRDLKYDATHIWSSSSTLRDHVVSLSYTLEYGSHNFYYGGFELKNLHEVAIDGTISTTFSKVYNEAIINVSRLDAYPSKVGIEVSLPSDHDSGEIIVYSTMGQRIASKYVAPSQSLVTIRELPAGFYFVRFGANVARVFVSQP